MMSYRKTSRSLYKPRFDADCHNTQYDVQIQDAVMNYIIGIMYTALAYQYNHLAIDFL